LNGYRGSCKVFWGGVRVESLKMLAASVQQFYSGGLRPSEKGILTINEKTGVELERIPDELLKSGGSQTAGKPSRGKNSNNDGE